MELGKKSTGWKTDLPECTLFQGFDLGHVNVSHNQETKN